MLVDTDTNDWQPSHRCLGSWSQLWLLGEIRSRLLASIPDSLHASTLLACTSRSQRTISTVGLGLDHNLRVVGGSSGEAGAITGPHGPGQAGRLSPVMREGLRLARRALSRAQRGGEGTVIISTSFFLGRGSAPFIHNLIESPVACKVELLFQRRGN